ncbi:MAG TPA: sugar phosphate nucleotidyltransferase [Candidatus Saccharimonas sp.]|jgi:UTP--glucose-1-phosphate uridylyltransferase|nr:sugar phosphate nucleotidyltransferase [Candidatus Saccharimonas sp.]
MQRPTKAIIAAAGFGTRFLPQTKAMPKEMMPLIDKPIIQYVVEELVAAGVKDIIIVGSSNKRSIEDHFDMPSEELMANLRAGGEKKQPFIDQIEAISNLANFIYIRQKGPYGNATPLACAAHLVGPDESFYYTWADDFFVATPSRFVQMADIAERHNGAVLSCKKSTSDGEYAKYGYVAGETMDDGLIHMSAVIEKPGRAGAPSDLASVSSYLLPGSFFAYLETAKENFDGQGEFTFQPIMQMMIDDGHDFYGYEIKNGTFYDTGDKLEYLKTVIDFGLKHRQLGPALREHMLRRVDDTATSE